MPTYQNTSGSPKTVVNDNGMEITLQNNEISKTKKYMSVSGLTKTSDLPYFNPILDYKVEVFGSASSRTITVSPDAAKVRILKVSSGANFDIFLQSESNTPAILRAMDSTDSFYDVEIRGRCDQIVLKCNTSSGTIHMIVMSELYDVNNSKR